MALHGSIGPFVSAQEDWTSYAERVAQYLTANNIKEAERQRAILLSVCGPATYRLFRDLVAPKKLTEYKFAELVDIMKKHQDPTPSIIVQRYNFNSRMQRSGESVASYVAELRHLSEHCKFGDILNDMLRDRLVCGISDSHIQRALLAEKELTFDKIYEKALAMESAEKNTQDLTPSAAVHSVGSTKASTSRSTQSCHRCMKSTVRQNVNSRKQSATSVAIRIKLYVSKCIKGA